MPWTAAQAKSHTKKANTSAKKKRWSKIATGYLKSHPGEEASAIRIANASLDSRYWDENAFLRDAWNRDARRRKVQLYNARGDEEGTEEWSEEDAWTEEAREAARAAKEKAHEKYSSPSHKSLAERLFGEKNIAAAVIGKTPGAGLLAPAMAGIPVAAAGIMEKAHQGYQQQKLMHELYEASRKERAVGDQSTISTPLLIRLLEYAREDAKTDIVLHKIAERLDAAKGVQRIEQYSEIVPEDTKNKDSAMSDYRSPFRHYEDKPSAALQLYLLERGLHDASPTVRNETAIPIRHELFEVVDTPVKDQKEVCDDCNGGGFCSTCGGSGWVDDTYGAREALEEGDIDVDEIEDAITKLQAAVKSKDRAGLGKVVETLAKAVAVKPKDKRIPVKDGIVRMYDSIDLADAGVHVTKDGYLTATPCCARTGIQEYSGAECGRPDMDVVRIYRPADEVFDKAALRSFAHKPLTLDHPSEDVNASNWKKYAVGHVGDEILRDGERFRVPIMLSDAAAIESFKKGTKQLSWGYDCHLDFTSGVTDDGEPYDAVQRKLRANHLAVVSLARGGPKLNIGDAGKDDGPTTTGRSLCPECQGKRMVHGQKCQACNGEGFIDDEEKLRRNSMEAA